MIEVEEKKSLNIKFENFAQTLEQEDLFDKTERLDKALNSGVLTGNEALGMVTMNKVQPDSKIREKDGSIHSLSRDGDHPAAFLPASA